MLAGRVIVDTGAATGRVAEATGAEAGVGAGDVVAGDCGAPTTETQPGLGGRMTILVVVAVATAVGAAGVGMVAEGTSVLGAVVLGATGSSL